MGVIELGAVNLNKELDFTSVDWGLGLTGTSAGIIPKSTILRNGIKYFIKLNSYSEPFGFYGNEALLELINSRIGKILNVPVLHYDLYMAHVIMNKKRHKTLASVSKDYKIQDYKSISVERLYREHKKDGETPLDILRRLGLSEAIYRQFAYDYIICNMDRHGKNNEILQNQSTVRLAPYFDNSLTFMLNRTESDIKCKKRYNDEMRVNNFIGYMNLKMNLHLIDRPIILRKPRSTDRKFLFQGLGNVTTRQYRDYIWEMLQWRVFEIENQKIQFIRWG